MRRLFTFATVLLLTATAWADFDDGLAAFVVESSGTDPYSNATIYSASADASMKSGVQQPSLSTVKVSKGGIAELI